MCVFALGVFAGCSSSEQTAAESASAVDPLDQQTGSVTATTVPSNSQQSDSGSAVDIAGDDSGAVTSPPAGRPSPTQGETDDNFWIADIEMTSASIHLIWSEVEGVDGYEVHRLSRDEFPDAEALVLTDATLLWSGLAQEHVDESVVPGERYWYVAWTVGADGAVQQRWTMADAVTDTTPPSAVTGLEVEFVDDGILLEWDQSSDNYAFDRYAIRRSHNGEQSIYYGTGWTVDQTSFIDDQLPDSGTITYEVIATDFHGNLAEAATASLTL